MDFWKDPGRVAWLAAGGGSDNERRQLVRYLSELAEARPYETTPDALPIYDDEQLASRSSMPRSKAKALALTGEFVVNPEIEPSWTDELGWTLAGSERWKHNPCLLCGGSGVLDAQGFDG